MDNCFEVSILSTVNQANEVYETNGEIILTRNGSLDRDLDVKLVIQGTAKMGDDYYYIPSEITIPEGTTESTILVRPINDDRSERDRVLEVFVVEEDDYDVKGPASARITITEATKPGDVDGNNQINIKDLITILQFFAGDHQSNINIKGDLIGDKRIALPEVLHVMSLIAK